MTTPSPKARPVRYRCEFKFAPFGSEVRCAVWVGEIQAVMLGFWINGNWEYTTGDDAAYWIPPSKIDHVAKDRSGR